MPEQTYYFAVASKERFAVATNTLFSFRKLGDFREFDTFDEADEVAKDIAAGEYPDLAKPGKYFCNR